MPVLALFVGVLVEKAQFVAKLLTESEIHFKLISFFVCLFVKKERESCCSFYDELTLLLTSFSLSTSYNRNEQMDISMSAHRIVVHNLASSLFSFNVIIGKKKRRTYTPTIFKAFFLAATE